MLADGATLSSALKEGEAEAVAYLCCASLGLMDGLDESRGYVQAWMSGASFSDKNVQRIFAAADRILKAGGQSPDQAMSDEA